MRRATRVIWLPLLLLSLGCASSRCATTSCATGGCATGGPVGPLVPYKDACQSRETSHNMLGRLWGFVSYRPLCAKTPCDCADVERCTPPLFSFFTCSKYNRCYEPIDCDGKKLCTKTETCATACDEPKGPTTICITLPKISFGRSEATCPAPKPVKAACATPVAPCRTLKLPGPIADPCRPKLFDGCGPIRGALSGAGSCNSCGSGGLLGNFGKTCCTSSIPPKVDINNLPVIAPQTMKGCAPGVVPTAPPPEAIPAPKVAEAKPADAPKPADEKLPVVPKPE